MKATSKHVRWFRSLTFKLFVLVSTLLFLAIGTVSWQHGRVLTDILSRQNTNNLLSSNQMTASSFHDNALFWLSLGNSIGHLAGASTDANFLSVTVEGLLESNRGLAAIQVFETTHLAKEILFRKTKHTPLELKGRKSEDMVAAIVAAGKKIIQDEVKSTKETQFLRNSSSQTEFPVVQIGTQVQFKTGSESIAKKEYWVIVHVWASTLASGLVHSDLLTSAVIDSKAGVLLNGAQEKNYALFSPIQAEDLTSLTQGSVAFTTWTKETEQFGPVLSSVTKLGVLNLMAITQKKVGAEQEEISRQVQRVLLWAWILFLVGLAVSYFAAENVTRRLGKLVEMTTEIASGNFGARIQVASKDEIALLSLAVNKMASDVQGLMEVRETAIRQQTELKMAEHIQTLLTPSATIARNAITTMSYFKPANECAGDWWGRFSFGDGVELIGIGDATGHGVQSALIAALVHAYFATVESKLREGVQLDYSPQALLAGLNSVMHTAGKGESTLTLCILLFDYKAKTLQWASAGHCNPMMWTGSKAKTLTGGNPIIGMEPNLTYNQSTEKIFDGQRFLVYTDGLIECKNANNDIIKKKTLQQVITKKSDAHISEVSRFLFSEVSDFFGNCPLSDDITMVMMEVTPQQAEAMR
jgi:serine phosphatase RsbU (regulator of sigma subunit)